MRLQSWLVLGGVSAISVLGCAANSTRGETASPVDSAIALGRAACPSDLRAGLEAIEATADWRLVGQSGLRYCVPATWVRDPHPRGDQWRSSNISVAAANLATIENDFPRTPFDVTARRGYFERLIGGYGVEYWYQAYQQEPQFRQPRDTRSIARTPEYPNGYQTFAVWRDAGVVMSGYSMTISGVAVLRAVVQTVRFDTTTAAPAAP